MERESERRTETSRLKFEPRSLLRFLLDGRGKPHRRHITDNTAIEIAPELRNLPKSRLLAQPEGYGLRVRLWGIGDLQDRLEAQALVADARPLRAGGDSF